MGAIIEKCTEQKPERRPTVKVLRALVLDTLVELGGHCRVKDEKSGQWLARFESIHEWGESDFEEFGRFFSELDIQERASEHVGAWVYSLSTPFLTRIPEQVLAKIAKRGDGLSEAIIVKYCEWVGATRFAFHFADSVCSRLTSIVDNGDPSVRAMAMVALIKLGESHNRWYVMRAMLHRCSTDAQSPEMARRIAIEIKTEELETSFARCVSEVEWDVSTLADHFKKFCEPAE